MSLGTFFTNLVKTIESWFTKADAKAEVILTDVEAEGKKIETFITSPEGVAVEDFALSLLPAGAAVNDITKAISFLPTALTKLAIVQGDLSTMTPQEIISAGITALSKLDPTALAAQISALQALMSTLIADASGVKLGIQSALAATPVVKNPQAVEGTEETT